MNTEASHCFHQPDGERLSRVEYAYRKLKNDITKNHYPAGFQILEPELAKVLGVSRTPVREALIRLEADNLIQLVPRKGMKVLPILHQDVSELIEATTAIQLSAVSIVCAGSDTPPLQFLENNIQRLHQAASIKDKSAWIEVDEKFHLELISLTNNSRTKRMFSDLLSQMHRAKYLAFDFLDSWGNFIAANSELLLALKEKREDAAASAIYRYRDGLVTLFDLAKEKHDRTTF